MSKLQIYMLFRVSIITAGRVLWLVTKRTKSFPLKSLILIQESMLESIRVESASAKSSR